MQIGHMTSNSLSLALCVSVGKVSTISCRRIKGDISTGEVNRRKQLRKGLHRLNIKRKKEDVVSPREWQKTLIIGNWFAQLTRFGDINGCFFSAVFQDKYQSEKPEKYSREICWGGWIGVLKVGQ